MDHHAELARKQAGSSVPHQSGETEVALSAPAALLTLYGNLSPVRRRALLPLLALMLAGAAAELATIGALMPFLALLTHTQDSPFLAHVAPLLDILGANGPRAVYVLTGLFALSALASAGLRLVLLLASASFVNGIVYELAVGLYDRVLHEPYVQHTRRNSSETIAAITKVERLGGGVLAPLMSGMVALVIATFVIAGLIAIDPTVALITGFGFSAIYLAIARMTRSRLRRNSRVIAEAAGRRVKAMQEGLGGIRDVLIDQSQPVFVETYERAQAGLRNARAKNIFLSGSPRFLVEALGLVMIAALAVFVTGRPGGLPVLGALALGAQRLLPLIQQIYGGWAEIMGSRQELLDVAALLRRPSPPRMPVGAALPFEKSIRLVDVVYAYASDRSPAIAGVSLEIPKGARVGLAGRTGGGKSTLMDLVLGLLEPTEGEISIDGVTLTARNRGAWQRNIAHVPQSIYLADATIAENIAFGARPEAIDRGRVRRAAEQAELAEVVAGLPKGFDTFVGERGIQLSGGQRQRIGIARALYKQANVLVFDEATSALDTETEGAVMAAIGRLDRSLTILIIAHRLSTLEGCDMIVRLEGGLVTAVERRREVQPRQQHHGSLE